MRSSMKTERAPLVWLWVTWRTPVPVTAVSVRVADHAAGSELLAGHTLTLMPEPWTWKRSRCGLVSWV
jgi:hypothetical protein